ncbi:MAG: sensor histidine kinase [Pseudoclavibacter sp.]
MLRLLDRLSTAQLRWLLEPAVGAIFITLWCFAEVGRWGSYLPFYAAPVIYGAAIGLSRRFPRIALGIALAVPILQLMWAIPMADSTGWPIHFGMPIVVFFVALNVVGLTRWIALGAGVVHGIGIAFLFVYVGGWLQWAGPMPGSRVALPGAEFPSVSDVIASQQQGSVIRDDGSVLTSTTFFEGAESEPSAIVDSYGPPESELMLQTAAQLAFIFALLAAAAWVLGVAIQYAIKRRRDQAMRVALAGELSASSAEVLLLQERSRISREVHDVLAHSLTVTISMADGSRLLRESRGEPADDLQKIADNARSTLLELQGLLEGIGGEGSAPQPKLDELDALIAQASSTGLKVELRNLGERKRLSQVQELSVFRIVQESLTNAMKHAGSEASATVSLDWRGAGLSLNIVSTGVGDNDTSAEAPERCGLGLAGMRERARLAGGWLTAGAEPSESEVEGHRTFVVTAFVPTQDIEPKVAATEEASAATTTQNQTPAENEEDKR